MSALAPAAPRLLRGGPIAAEINARICADLAAFRTTHGAVPALAVVLVGHDAPSAVYLHKILDGCRAMGIPDQLVELPTDASATCVADAVQSLSADASVAGIIIGQPLPPSISLRAVLDGLDPAKDIDGIHPLNAGLLALGYDCCVPATAHAAVEILKRSGIEIEGRRAVVVGRSNIVGKPVALLLLREHATVTICHSRTADLAAEIRGADIVVVAAGRPGLISGDMLRPGAVVVDVGINVVAGRIVGDVAASAYGVASAITPVPGGVGPLTNALLLIHLMRAAWAQAEGGRLVGIRTASERPMEIPA